MPDTATLQRLIDHASDHLNIVQTTLQGPVRDLEVRIDGARTQVVSVAAVKNDGVDVVLIMSWIGPADPSIFEDALRTNAELTYGSVAIVDRNSTPTLALVQGWRTDELTDDEFSNALREISDTADGLEARFFGDDLA